MNNENKIILDLCGGTGSWSKPYKDNGYDVRLITLPDNDVFNYIPPENVYGILAAPTCTMFSLARTTAKTPRDFNEGMLLVKRCLEIIWQCRINNKLKFWALENPRGYLRQFLGIPHLTFCANDYGDNYKKPTDLWGYFNIPKKNYRELKNYSYKKNHFNFYRSNKLPDNYKLPDNWNKSAALSSMTSSYFANAFYKANK